MKCENVDVYNNKTKTRQHPKNWVVTSFLLAQLFQNTFDDTITVQALAPRVYAILFLFISAPVLCYK